MFFDFSLLDFVLFFIFFLYILYKGGLYMDDSEILKTIGQNIQKARLKKGITQEQLSEICNVSDRHISIIERGLSSGSISVLIKICNALDIAPNYVFKDVTNTKNNNIDILPNDVSISYLKLGTESKQLANTIIKELYNIQKSQ